MATTRRLLLKRFCQYTCLLLTLPMVALSSHKLGKIGDLSYHFFATLLSLFPGALGSYLRVAFYRGVNGKIHPDINIGFGTFFTKREVIIERNVSIGAYCIIGSVLIGEYCQIASRVSIPSGRRQHSYKNGAAAEEPSFSQIQIGCHSWVGEAAVILESIGVHCTVGAGSVVVHKVEDNESAVGNPARKIRRSS